MDGLPTPRRYRAIAAVAFGTALAVIDGNIVAVALPTLARDLRVPDSAVVLVVAIYQLVLVMTVLPFSALGSRIGLRRLYQCGQALFLVSSVLCFFARSVVLLLTFRTFQALGAAAALSVSSALIRGIYPRRYLGRGLAINTVVVSSAGAIAPSLGGLVLLVASWPWIFVSTVPLALLSLLLGRRSLPDIAANDEPYDVLAALLCALTFGLVISGLQTVVQGKSAMFSSCLILLGVVLGVVFVRWELKSRMPILPVDLLARPVLGLSTLGALLAFIASMTLILSLPFRLQQHFGFSPAEIGAIITPWPLAMMISAPLAGFLSDRYPAGLLGAIGMSIVVSGLLLLAFLPAQVSHLDLIWRMALCGAGFGLFTSPNARFIVHSAPHARAASAGGLIATTRLTGQTLGATLVAALLSLGIGANRIPAFVAAGLAMLAGLCSVARLSSTVRNAGVGGANTVRSST
jgi:MFS transporter, DHA2 family, multidrug resistance protein